MELFWLLFDFFPLDTLNTTLEGLTVLVDVAGHYPTPLVPVVVTRVTRKTPAEPPPAAACCHLMTFSAARAVPLVPAHISLATSRMGMLSFSAPQYTQ